MKYFVVDEVSSEPEAAESKKTIQVRKALLHITIAVLEGYGTLLSAFQRKTGGFMLKFDFCERECTLDLNGVFRQMWTGSMVEAIYYHIVYEFIRSAALIDRASRSVRNTPTTFVPTKDSEALFQLSIYGDE